MIMRSAQAEEENTEEENEGKGKNTDNYKIMIRRTKKGDRGER